MKVYSALDIGGTAVKWGVVSEDGTLIESGQFPTQAERGPECWMKDVVSAVGEMKSKYSLSGLCVSSTAMIDSEKGEYSSPATGAIIYRIRDKEVS